MNSKNAKYYKGALEKEGMGEVAYFFKKAGQNINYASYALDNAELSDASLKVKAIATKIEEIMKLSSEVIAEMDSASISICDAAAAKEDSDRASAKQSQTRHAQLLESMSPRSKDRR